MILNEQVHKNLYRQYFRGQRKDYLKSKANFIFTCFSTSPLYAIYYAKKENGDLFVYYLKNNVNIFNARSKKDFYNLHKYIIDNNLNYEYSVLERLRNEDWSFVCGNDNKRSKIIDIIKKLGYDGFFNFEWTEDMKEALENFYPSPNTINNPAICVFDSEKCFISEKVDNIMGLDAVVDYRKKEIAQIKKGYYEIKQIFGKETAYSAAMISADRWLTVDAYEVKDILEKLKTFDLEKANEVLDFLKNTHRLGFEEAALKLKEEINAQTK